MELFINKVNDEKFLKIMNDHFNLFASWLIKELNPKSNTIFGSIYIMKLNLNNDVLNIQKHEFRDVLFNTIYMTYYAAIDYNIYVSNKLNYKYIIDNDDISFISLDEKNKLVCMMLDNKKIWTHYNIRFNDFKNKNDHPLNFTDKLNLMSLGNIKEIFSWGNITNNHIKLII